MNYILSKAQYEFLRKECQTTNSLVPDTQNIELNNEELKDLEKKNCLENGKISSHTLSMMKTICSPLTIQRQRLINMDVSIEQALYYRRGESLVCVSENTEGVKIENPYKNESDLEAISQYFGSSILKGMAFNLSLPVAEAIVLSGVWDCVRKNNLSKIYDEDLVDWVRKDELLAFVQEIESSQSLCFFIKAYSKFEVDRALILDQLKILERKGLIEGGERITLTDKTFEIIMRFQHIKTMLQLTTAFEDGITYGSEMLILQDGVMDILLMEIGSENVNFLSMASLEVIALLDSYYNTPETFLGELYEDEDFDSKTEESEVKFCSACGAKRPKDGKFCSECGAKF